MTWATGYDVSHYQSPTVNHQRIALGDTFCFIKATDGRNHDRALPAHHDAASAISRGPYHFYRSAQNPLDQAHFFHDTTSPYAWELPHVCDYENESGAESARELLTFLTWVETLTGRIPIIYTNRYHWDATIGNDPKFARYPLWIARYPKAYVNGNPPPATDTTPIPAPWDDFDLWQYSTTNGTLDRNVATVESLARLLDHPAPTPPQGFLPMLNDKEQRELLDKVRDLHKQWIGTKTDAGSEALRQVLREVDAHTTPHPNK